MFEGSRLQVDKLENGFGIKKDTFLAGDGENAQTRKYVFTRFSDFVKHLREEFGVKHETVSDVLVDCTLPLRTSVPKSGDIQYEMVRDELGNQRAVVRQKETKIAELEKQLAWQIHAVKNLSEIYEANMARLSAYDAASSAAKSKKKPAAKRRR